MIRLLVCLALLAFMSYSIMLAPVSALDVVPAIAAEKWTGVDESVVEKIAQEHGRAAREPLVNTDNGDLLLFVFLVAGVIGGFIAGYNWRVITERKDGESDSRKQFKTGEIDCADREVQLVETREIFDETGKVGGAG